ncbi:hypothetical protein AVEN_176548-1 [Araneus ventricosus]|uniref:Uncharacterized protein n=1 Tax=Araneus ventricosus TaxID=182803 RepID=A0A4Y2KSL7_ARAVE|nr:hypothetical protein AVEN_176548-1 [Araneus ventricosus]
MGLFPSKYVGETVMIKEKMTASSFIFPTPVRVHGGLSVMSGHQDWKILGPKHYSTKTPLVQFKYDVDGQSLPPALARKFGGAIPDSGIILVISNN